MVDFKDRHTYLGGSDAAAACGVSPWQTPLQLYLEKTQDERQAVRKESNSNDPMYWGTVLEAPIANSAKGLGLKLRKVNKEFIHPKYPFIRGHIDRKVEGEDEMVEIKNIGYRTAEHWGETGTDQIPLYYMTQAFHYLGLTPYKGCHFLVLVGGQDLRHYYLPRDDATIKMLYAKEAEFWEKVQTGSPPEPTTSEDINLLFPKSVAEILDASPAMVGNLRSLEHAKTSQKAANEIVESYENIIKYEMGQADTISMGEYLPATWKSQNRTGFDTAKFKEDHPDLYKIYKTTSSHRVLRTKTMKDR